jgi:three-Cys-motif partner protein
MAGQLKVSQETLMEHSAVKLQLLQNYMGAYLNILSRATGIRDIHLFDLFCGPGIYPDGGKGSPMILLQEIAQTNESLSGKTYAPTTFHCLFNDLSKERIEELKENVAKSGLNETHTIRMHYRNLEYREALELAVDKFQHMKSNARGFAFIDPYGYKEIRLDDIKRLLSSGKSEVLLFLPAHFMFRFRENGTPESLKSFLNDVLPEGAVIKNDGGVDFIDSITDGFREKLDPKHYVDSFVIEREKNQFFCLFFFTSNLLGFQKMLEAKWRIDKEDGRGWSMGAEATLFSMAEKRANIGKLKDLLRNYIGMEGRTNNEIRDFALSHGYLPPHVSDVLNEMKAALVVEALDGKPSRGLYIADNTRSVRIKMKN